MNNQPEIRTCRACLGTMVPFSFIQLRKIVAGWVCCDCGRAVWQEEETDVKKKEREAMVLAMYQNGIRQVAIAKRLNISDRTVRRVIADHPDIRMGRDITRHLNTGREYDLWFAEWLVCKNQAVVAKKFGVSRARVNQVIRDRHHANYTPKPLNPEMEIVANAT